jgi:peptidyl-prolyl cis-trans isomerase C
MKDFRATLVVPLVCTGLAACQFSHSDAAKAPTGQVVATVDGQEVTVTNLESELAGHAFTDPIARKAAEQAALRAIISRTILADAARGQGLDKTPEFAIERQRVIDSLLVQSLAAKIAVAVPPPAREEAESFMAAHPDGFAQRKIYTVDQIRTAQAADPALLAALKPLTTLEDVEALLTQRHIEFHRVTTDLDALALDPTTSDSIAKLPPNDVFVIPTNGSVLISQIKQTRVQPFMGEPATRFALNQIQRQRSREATLRELEAIVAKGAKSVRYNQQFAPPLAASPPGSKSVGS